MTNVHLYQKEEGLKNLKKQKQIINREVYDSNFEINKFNDGLIMTQKETKDFYVQLYRKASIELQKSLLTKYHLKVSGK